MKVALEEEITSTIYRGSSGGIRPCGPKKGAMLLLSHLELAIWSGHWHGGVVILNLLMIVSHLDDTL